MKLLLVEDDIAVAGMIRKGLAEAGYAVTVAPDGNMGWDMASNNDFDIIILDVMLPGINGLEICKQLRKSDIHTPVIMLTALGTTENIVNGLDNGADDYLVKPFSFAELEARLRTLARRKSATFRSPELMNMGDLTVNTAAKTVTRNGLEIALTSTEYRLLEFFMRNRGRVLSRIELLESVWGIDFNMGTNVVDVYVNYLRKKLGNDNDRKLIHTVIGMGYILKEPQA